MTQNGKSLTAALIAITALSTSALSDQSEEKKNFDGFYSGAEVSLQNIYSGAMVNNIDVLQNNRRAVGSLLAGWRKQTDSGWVFGLEAQFGLNDGNLERSEPAQNLHITYQNSTQVAAGLTLGRVFGDEKDWLLYGYTYVTRRNFDLTIREAAFEYTQEDAMGVLRFGLGLEKQWQSGWGLRVSAGSNYTDFGGLTTNMNVNGKFETAASVIFQF